nr:DUF2827 domain-containing protein [Variovorax dokdonensis]
MKVGVSIYVRKGDQSLWENGIFQNCLFLVLLLLESPCVEEVVLVAGGSDARPEDARRFLADSPVPLIDMPAALERLDVMIEMSAQLAREWVVQFRERGGRVISMRVGNDYAIDAERMIFNKPHGLVITAAPYDEIWTLAEYEQVCVPYFNAAFRAPVRLVPHLWSPVVLEQARQRAGCVGEFAYQSGRTKWRVGIFEPNICMVKTSFTPMLACEVAHRARARMIEHLWVFNTLEMKDKPAFVGFAQSLDLVRHGLATFEGRFPVYEMLPAQVDAVVAHQWENAQNYLYYEALYGGFPLVHNSHLLGDCGYRYEGFDCEEAGAALLRAFDEHDPQLARYRASAQAFLAQLDPTNEDNVRFYTSAIEEVVARP